MPLVIFKFHAVDIFQVVSSILSIFASLMTEEKNIISNLKTDKQKKI